MVRVREPEDVELLEREGEQAALAALVAAACRGTGQCAVVEGTAGIGKTRLLTAARAQADQVGMRVLAARGSELEREFAYGVVRQLFEPVLAGASNAERAELLAGAAGQVASLFGQPDPSGRSSADGDTSFAMVHGLYWLTVNLCGQRPTLLCVDDLHWSDAPSLRLLAYLLPRLEGLRLLMLVGLRPAEPATEQDLLAQITTDPLVRLVRPAPLSQDGSAQLIRAVLSGEVEEGFCTACHVATGGNPLWLRELVGVAVAEGFESTAAGAARLAELGPRAVGRRVALRLARLGSAAEAVCAAVAILGDGAVLAQVAALARLELAETAEAACQLVDAEILYRQRQSSLNGASRLFGGVLGFVHPLVRVAVYEQLSETERLAGHARAARLLADAGAAAEEVAAHLLLVPPTGNPSVVATLRGAADEALARGSPESAVAYLERCLAEPPEPVEHVDVLVQLGAAAQLVDMAKAAEYLTAALARVQEPERRAVIAEMVALTLFLLGERFDEAVQVCSQAAQALGEEHADLRRQLDAALLLAAPADPGLRGVAAECVSRLRDVPVDVSPGGRMLDTQIALYDTLSTMPAEAAVARARRGLADGVIEQSSINPTLVSGCMVLMAADLEEVMPLLDALLAWAHQHGSMRDFGYVRYLRGMAWLWRGALAEAEANLRNAMQAIEAMRADVGRPLVGAPLADALMEQGRLAEAAVALDWAGMPEPLPRTGFWYWCLDSRARLLILQGRIEEGLEMLLACGRRFAAHGGRNPAFVAWRSSAAQALLALDRRDEAHTLVTEELDLAQRWGAPRALGRALRVAGLVEGGEKGLILLQEAVDVLAPSPARLEHAKTLVELGAVLRRAGWRVECREHLRRGIEQAQVCGAAPLVKRGWIELRASGARPRRVEPSGPAALTPSERRVAELAAAGRSNRDIAQALFVTINTVETHLTRAYRKLGITRRAGLTQALSSA
jgi:DNA-binding CsgD family transcriptional regulator